MLHVVNTFPIPQSLLSKAHYGDVVIFTENAVLAVKQGNSDFEELAQKALGHINLCARKADLLIRNISKSELLRGVTILDDMQIEMAQSQDCAVRSCN